MVYILAGSVLIFYLEECVSDRKSSTRVEAFTGNATELCVRLISAIFTKPNETRSSGSKKHLVTHMHKCWRLLQNEAAIVSAEGDRCSWSWRSIRKWVKFSHSTLTTIGEWFFFCKTIKW